MAIVQHSEAGASSTPASTGASVPPASTPGLFVKTILPAGAVSCSLPCALFPPAVLSARLEELGHVSSAAAAVPQNVLVTASPGALAISAVIPSTSALVELERLPVFGTVHALAKISALESREDSVSDVLLVLTDASQVSFMHFDTICRRVICSGPCPLFGFCGPLLDVKPRKDARLLVSHPRRPLAAVATLESTVSVFPILFMGETVDAGKVASDSVDGIVLSLTFLEDDGGALAVLIALVQKRTEQSISLFSVGTGSADGGGLSISLIRSMGTCATRYDDIALARLEAKRTGVRQKPPPEADMVAMIPDCPYLFAVCLEGRVAVADAGAVARDAEARGAGGLPAVSGSSRPRSDLESSMDLSSKYRNVREGGQAAAGNDAWSGGGSGTFPRAESGAGSSSRDRDSMQVDDTNAGGEEDVAGEATGARDADGSDNTATASAGADTAAFSNGVDALSGPNTAALSSAGEAEGWGVSTLSAPSHAGPTVQSEVGSASMSSPTEEFVMQDVEETGEDPPADGPIEHPSSASQDLELAGNQDSGRSTGDILRVGSRGNVYGRTGSISLGGNKGLLAAVDSAQSLLPQRYTPPHIGLDIGGSCEGIAVAVAQAGPHFTRAIDTKGLHEDDRGNGMYLVMESGRMFILRWRRTLRRDGPPCFVIPPGNSGMSGKNIPGACPFFSLEFVGDVGPVATIAALDEGLLYLANDSADGSLRHVHFPDAVPVSKYGLAVRQEFLNLAPISDFDFGQPVKKRVSRKQSSRQSRSDPQTSRVSLRPRREQGSSQIRQKKSLGSKPGKTRRGLPDNGRKDGWCDDNERELVVGSGIGRHGTIRILKPGTHVSVFSSSKVGDQCCNGMWEIRLAKKARHHSLLVMTFPETTGVFCIVPPGETSENSAVARLLDGSEASNLLLLTRTLACGRVSDGVIAQAHRNGIRFVWLKKPDDGSFPPFVEDSGGERLVGSFVSRSFDWMLPQGCYVSCACVGGGYVVVSVMAPAQKPRLVLLELVEGGRSSEVPVRESCSVELQDEVSSVAVPSWIDEGQGPLFVGGSAVRDVVLVTTYGPEIQVRDLREGLRLVAASTIPSWPPLKPSTGPGAAIAATSGCKAESICGVKFGSRFVVAAGLRDGNAVAFEIVRNHQATERSDREVSCMPLLPCRLELTGRRGLGMNPVRLSVVTVAFGKTIMAECERPWLGRMSAFGTVSWIPLSFPETIAGTPLSVPGAERCLALVSSDNVLHICGIKRPTPVTVSTVRIGDTPRRVVSLGSPVMFVIVATSNNDAALPSCSVPQETASLASYLRREVAGGNAGSRACGDGGDAKDCEKVLDKPKVPRLTDGEQAFSTAHLSSDVRIYDCRLKGLVCKRTLLPDELVHVLLTWRDFIVVGTSFQLRNAYDESGLREAYKQGSMPCNKGRLMLLTVKDISPKKRELVQCGSVSLPGAVLAGASNETEECLVVSCNEHIFVFGMTSSRKGFYEIARTSTRMLVTSLSIRQGLVCASDRKDSVAFYRINCAAGLLVRDRGDFRRRVVSDSVLVDDYTAIVADRYGHLFSLAYDSREESLFPANICDTSAAKIPLRFLRADRKCNNRLADSEMYEEVESGGEETKDESEVLDHVRVAALERLLEGAGPYHLGLDFESQGLGGIESYEALLRQVGLTADDDQLGRNVEMPEPSPESHSHEAGSSSNFATSSRLNDDGGGSSGQRGNNGEAGTESPIETDIARRLATESAGQPPFRDHTRGPLDNVGVCRTTASDGDAMRVEDLEGQGLGHSSNVPSTVGAVVNPTPTLAGDHAEMQTGEQNRQPSRYPQGSPIAGPSGLVARDSSSSGEKMGSDGGNPSFQEDMLSSKPGAGKGANGRWDHDSDAGTRRQQGNQLQEAQGCEQDDLMDCAKHIEGDEELLDGSDEDDSDGETGSGQGASAEGAYQTFEFYDDSVDDGVESDGSEDDDADLPATEETSAGGNEEDLLLFHGRQPIQRHLVCNHSFNMHDVSLRVRRGSFARRECRRALNRTEYTGRPSFWSGEMGCAMAATLSGALVVAVPVSREDMSLLCRLVKELVLSNPWGCKPLGMDYGMYERVFGEPGQGVVDGDLLAIYLFLTPQQQGQIAKAAGCESAREIDRLVDVITELCDRAM